MRAHRCGYSSCCAVRMAASARPVHVYCLFLIVLALASAMVGCVVTCATWCIAAIPYVGTVILLPVFVLLRSFSLLFLRQFGPKYDVWASFTGSAATITFFAVGVK